ncbi:DEAD/DEAH box helicase family protein [Streptomyces sp. SID10362]|uniref:DEAD/DEAH box helicase family protein n=1 Tax=Streptomyces sp. SID10362 TaxID=2706021 RepID=UPI0013C9236B|nr:DEAD/DEAH box helicase family protein [Streptomyces sp. SID10362]NDZ75395.1 DEAD/DEAH box helicase family protein [Streptomyces sp. SID10362]
MSSAGGASQSPDPRLVRLARQSRNFGFLLPHLPLLVAYGTAAESHVFSDPNTSLIKSRQFAEAMAADLVSRGRVRVEGSTQFDRLRALDREGYLHGDVGTAFHEVRTLGNEASHAGLDSADDAFRALRTCFRLGTWYHRLLTGSREQLPFVPPSPDHTPAVENERLLQDVARARRELEEARVSYHNQASQAQAQQAAKSAVERELAQAQAEREELARAVAAMRSQLEEFQAAAEATQLGRRHASATDRAAASAAVAERARLLDNAEQASREPLTEVQVRKRLDAMLTAAGWDVQDSGADLNLHVQGDRRGNGVAVREVTTARGRADYALYVDRRLVGVIEAKREGADLSAAEAQADRYADHPTDAQQRLNAWRTPLPFRYVSDGGETRFRSVLDPDSRTRRVFSFHQPRTLARWVRQAEEDEQAPSYRARLRYRMPELDERPLRPAQVEAVRGVENSLALGKGQQGMGQSRALVQMATGAGKTFTAVTFSYRILKHARAERVLFLVDRNNLGAQAFAEFENFRTPDTDRKFADLYNVQRLGAEGMFVSSKVVISTVQRLYMELTGASLPSNGREDREEGDIGYDVEVPGGIEVGYNPDIPPEAFDLIIVDECHRSIYGKWRSVLEYFDAPIVGLTATPVAQTFGYFNGNLVSEYSYQEAVADRVNVDFSVYEIATRITAEGGVIAQGTIPVRDRRTRRQRYEDIDEDFEYGANQVGVGVISKDQLRTVVQTFHDRLFTEIFPERAKHDPATGALLRDEMYVPKTLVFAKNDNHAEEIVEVVRDVFGKGNDFCAKITSAARNAAERLAAFRNLPDLRIAVTVDMIATGTDVKPLECLLFLRDVKSWAYFEQMKGRGARTLSLTDFEKVTPGVGPKTRFVIVDAVGVTKKPKVDAAPLERHTDKQISLEKLLRKTAANTIEEEEVSTLAARLSKLDIQMTDEERTEIQRLSGGLELTKIVHGMVEAVSADRQLEVREAAERTGRDPERAVRDLIERAVQPLAAQPPLRARLLEMRRAKDILYDENGADELLRAGAVVDDEDTAARTVRDWRRYIDDHRDEIAAMSIAFSAGSDVPPGVAMNRLNDVARSIARPPRAWTPDRLWQAYEKLGEAVTDGTRRTHAAPDLLALLRYELAGGAERGAPAPRPYAAVVRERYQAWIFRQEQLGNRFTERQRWWLDRIAEATGKGVRFDTADLDYAPFTSRNGTDGFIAEFGGARAEHIITELDRELSA